jgi:two-component system chemotaxis response regulator CheY
MAADALRPLILICDDELPLRELVKAALGEGYRYVEASDAHAAEAALAVEKPRVIILDVMLPGKSGIEFLEGLRPASNDVPPSDAQADVVVISAWHTDDVAEAAFAAGAQAFIGKPFDPMELAAVVEGFVAQ